MFKKGLMGIFLSLLLAVCLIAGPAAAETVKLGFIGDFNGPSFQMTKDAEQAARLALDKINAGGGVLGQQLELINRDGGARPELHARLAHEVVEQEKVAAIFGGASSNCVLGASAVAKELKTPYLVSVGNAPSIIYQKGHPYVTLFEPNLGMEMNAWVEFCLTRKNWKKYAWIAPDYEGTRNLLKSFKAGMEAKGAQITWTKELWHKLGETTFTSHIPVLKASQADVIFIMTFGSSLNAFILQASQAGLFKQMEGFGFIAEDTCMALGDKMPAGLAGFSRGAFNYFMNAGPAGKEFVTTYKDKYGAYPGGFSFCAYDSILGYAAAAEKAGSFDKEKVAQALRGIKFSGPRGEMSVRAVDGQINAPVCIGMLKYNQDYGFAVLDPVNPIPADKVWLSEAEAAGQIPKE